jgi:hypothetical protein
MPATTQSCLCLSMRLFCVSPPPDRSPRLALPTAPGCVQATYQCRQLCMSSLCSSLHAWLPGWHEQSPRTHGRAPTQLSAPMRRNQPLPSKTLAECLHRAPHEHTAPPPPVDHPPHLISWCIMVRHAACCVKYSKRSHSGDSALPHATPPPKKLKFDCHPFARSPFLSSVPTFTCLQCMSASKQTPHMIVET